jgi:predicted ATPase
MITRIEIDGFKSFKDFTMEFTPLTVIAGANASGKSNLFDALQLLSDIAEVELSEAFDRQRGDAGELFLKYGDGESINEMSFAVEMKVDKKVKDNWGQEKTLEDINLRYEIKIQKNANERGFEYLAVTHEWLCHLHGSENLLSSFPVSFTSGEKLSKVNLGTHQSIVSAVLVSDFEYIFAAREEMRNWKIMQLNPESLKKPTPQKRSNYNLSRDGENLAGVLYQLSSEDEYFLVEISNALNGFIPGFTEVKVEYSEVYQSYYFKLRNSNGQEFSSQLLSEGTLRFLALCTMLYNPDQKGVLCFEEPENGIHPYQIRSMLELLKKISEPFNEWEQNVSQVIVNTHSPIVMDEAIQWNDRTNASVWFMRIDTLITNIGNKRVGMRVTRSTPVYDEFQPSSDYSEQEQKMTIHEVKKYLNSIRS